MVSKKPIFTVGLLWILRCIWRLIWSIQYMSGEVVRVLVNDWGENNSNLHLATKHNGLFGHEGTIAKPVQTARSAWWSWVATVVGRCRLKRYHRKLEPSHWSGSTIWTARGSRPGVLPVEVATCHQDSSFQTQPALRVEHLDTHSHTLFCQGSGSFWIWSNEPNKWNWK